jgi:hypothetical protein
MQRPTAFLRQSATIRWPVAAAGVVAGWGLALACQAQTPAAPVVAAPASTAPATTAPEQRTERITHHDAGSRIEELRIGGQTRSIDVETNSSVPGYQVQPLDAAQPDASTGQPAGKAGKSSWRVLSF